MCQGFYSWCLWGSQEITSVFKKEKKNVVFLKSYQTIQRPDEDFTVHSWEHSMDNGWALSLCSGGAAGLGFMLPRMDVSLGRPGKHACGRREIGEWVQLGGSSRGGRRGKWKWDSWFVWSFSLPTFHASLFCTFTLCSEYITYPAKQEKEVDA